MIIDWEFSCSQGFGWQFRIRFTIDFGRFTLVVGEIEFIKGDFGIDCSKVARDWLCFCVYWDL